MAQDTGISIFYEIVDSQNRMSSIKPYYYR